MDNFIHDERQHKTAVKDKLVEFIGREAVREVNS